MLMAELAVTSWPIPKSASRHDYLGHRPVIGFHMPACSILAWTANQSGEDMVKQVSKSFHTVEQMPTQCDRFLTASKITCQA